MQGVRVRRSEKIRKGNTAMSFNFKNKIKKNYLFINFNFLLQLLPDE